MALKDKLVQLVETELNGVNADYVKSNKSDFSFSQDQNGNDVGNAKLTLATIGQGTGRFAAAETVRTVASTDTHDCVLKFRGQVYLELVPKKANKPAQSKDRF